MKLWGMLALLGAERPWSASVVRYSVGRIRTFLAAQAGATPAAQATQEEEAR